jgi:hypothetical protein
MYTTSKLLSTYSANTFRTNVQDTYLGYLQDKQMFILRIPSGFRIHSGQMFRTHT